MSTCISATTLNSSPPYGGSGQSAKCSRIFFAPPGCGSGINLNGTAPSTTLAWFAEQVISIEVKEMIDDRQYVHDKSFCAKDETPGAFSWNGSIKTRMQCQSPAISIHAGALIWLQVYPLGVVNGGYGSNPPCISGYARITEAPMVMNLENGDPIERNYTYNSKGVWNGAAGISGVYDCCQCCPKIPGSVGEQFDEKFEEEFEGSVHEEALRLGGLAKATPYTVYQWTNAEKWAVALDECVNGFVKGPSPDEAQIKGDFVGQMKFVQCLAV